MRPCDLPVGFGRGCFQSSQRGRARLQGQVPTSAQPERCDWSRTATFRSSARSCSSAGGSGFRRAWNAHATLRGRIARKRVRAVASGRDRRICAIADAVAGIAVAEIVHRRRPPGRFRVAGMYRGNPRSHLNVTADPRLGCTKVIWQIPSAGIQVAPTCREMTKAGWLALVAPMPRAAAAADATPAPCAADATASRGADLPFLRRSGREPCFDQNLNFAVRPSVRRSPSVESYLTFGCWIDATPAYSSSNRFLIHNCTS